MNTANPERPRRTAEKPAGRGCETDADMSLETERTPASALLCALCGTPMRSRRPQAKFCSDVCRTRAGRLEHDRRVGVMLDTLARTVESLRAELASSSRSRRANDESRPSVGSGEVK
jgi:hypothetical protein